MSKTKEIMLETLTPIILDDDQKEKLNYKSYEAILDKVFATEDFCNIALTGPYGAGKSTIDYSARFVPRIADMDTCNPRESYHLYAH